MHFAVDDTIAAVASPPGGAVRGVIRVSGPGTLPCLDACFRAAAGPPLDSLRAPTRLRGHLLLAAPIGPLPCHLYLWPTRRSYTRQPSAELHTLGSPPLLDAAMTRLCQCGARLAVNAARRALRGGGSFRPLRVLDSAAIGQWRTGERGVRSAGAARGRAAGGGIRQWSRAVGLGTMEGRG